MGTSRSSFIILCQSSGLPALRRGFVGGCNVDSGLRTQQATGSAIDPGSISDRSGKEVY